MYQDANGIQHEDYEAACHYYGADTPSSLAAEGAAQFEEENELEMDDMIARGAPVRFAFQFDDIPF